MNAVAYGLGQLIGLVLIPAALIWALRGTRPGRVVLKTCTDARGRRRARQAAAERLAAVDAYRRWMHDLAWWGWYRAQHQPGSPQFELAQTIIGNLELRRPPNPDDPRRFTS